jgi:hypothetical protein
MPEGNVFLGEAEDTDVLEVELTALLAALVAALLTEELTAVGCSIAGFFDWLLNHRGIVTIAHYLGSVPIKITGRKVVDSTQKGLVTEQCVIFRLDCINGRRFCFSDFRFSAPTSGWRLAPCRLQLPRWHGPRLNP